MSIDFSKLSRPRTDARPTDPIALFRSLRVTDAAINDLWMGQADTLRDWHAQRSVADVAVVLNTGAGKTLIGLLAAQSLVNETNGHVLYTCGSNQLVQQTAEKARGYGLNVTTYQQSTFSNDLYQQGLAPCIVTYHALFNGRSRFFNDDVSAVVFDDAHTAGHILRDQYTLRIGRESFPSAFAELVQLFRPFFTRIGKEMGYLEAQDHQDAMALWFVPPFALREQFGELQRILREADLGDPLETKFAWLHLRNHLEACALLVSGVDVTLTPPAVPVLTLPYFRDGVRRLYLSATLAAPDAFLRAFGRVPDQVIAAQTPAGESERLILIPALQQAKNSKVRDTDVARAIIEGQKALVLVPTRRRQQLWKGVATNSDDSVTEQVEQFKDAQPPQCLVLTARYDGVDLPGDTCRLLVIDDLPTGLNPLERFLWDQLGLAKVLRSTIASRIVQSFGRISRGMGDYGVVLVTGERLVNWLLVPRQRALLPAFLQRQLRLGMHLSRELATTQGLIAAARQCLARDPQWEAYYQSTLNGLDVEPEPPDDTEEALRIARAEVSFGDAIWQRDYAGAAKALERGLEETFAASRPAGAWHALWLGYCYDCMGDADRARALYDRAHRASVHKLPPVEAIQRAVAVIERPYQVERVAALLLRANSLHLQIPRQFDAALAALDGGASPKATEAALDALGEYLGLDSCRPDNEDGTGPDVLWSVPEGPALSMEAKTDKAADGVYRKDDLGQLRDHRQWVVDHLGPIEVHSAFVGPLVGASADANPDADTSVIELAEFRQVRDRLRAALSDACNRALPLTAQEAVHDVFAERGLLWPALYAGVEKHKLRNL